MSDNSRILVIKLSSLGDMIMALGAFRAIRDHHKSAHLTLLTTARFRDIASRSGLFDDIWIDDRASPLQVGRWLGHIVRLRNAGFDRVYDLQWSKRSGWYYRLLAGCRPEWVGIVPGCSHQYPTPRKDAHIMQRHREMLALAGISDVPKPDLGFLGESIDRFHLAAPYALLVPGSSQARLDSRWPVENYIEVAKHLEDRGIRPVIVFGEQERDVAAAIKAACPEACDIEPSLGEIVSLAQGATLAVANNTGPMHMIVHAGCPTVLLLSGEYSLAKATPPGASIALQGEPIDRIAVPAVREAVDRLLGAASPTEGGLPTGT